MKSPADEIARHLAENRLGEFASNSGWSIATAREPAKPDDTITVYDTGGRDPASRHCFLYQPTIQIRSRSHDYGRAYEKLAEASYLLYHSIHLIRGGIKYISLNQTGDITSLGVDDNDRFRLTLNFQLQTQPLVATGRIQDIYLGDAASGLTSTVCDNLSHIEECNNG